MKIKQAIWFTPMGGEALIGIVMGETDHGEKKAYIGFGHGEDEEEDCNLVAQTGAKLHGVQLQEILDFLNK